MTDDEFGDRVTLINAKVSALMKEAAGLRKAIEHDPKRSAWAHLSVAELAVQLAAIEIIALETDGPDPDKLREFVSKHARASRDA